MRSRSYPLSREEISYYHSLLGEEITDYDCGNLCRPDNGGVSFCCRNDLALPWLYRSEFSLLFERSGLWQKWRPRTDSEKALSREAQKGDIVFSTCSGEAGCERVNRSISCRTFPLEPYIDERGVFSALQFMQEFREHCPLSSRPADIRQAYIDAHFTFWEKLLLRRPEDFETYEASSRRARRQSKKTGEPLVLLRPGWP